MAYRELRPLDGKLVEIKGLSESDIPGLQASDDVTADLLNQAHGKVVEHTDAGRCVVRTFDGIDIVIPEANLEEYEPPEPEEGGFDVIWPDAASGGMGQGIFASMVAEDLASKGFCIIQLDQSKDFRAEVISELSLLQGECLLPVDFEQEYLGNDSNEKIVWYPFGLVEENSNLGLEICDFNLFGSFASLEGLDPLAQCDRMMTNLGMLMWPLAPELPVDQRPFVAWGRTNPLVRKTISSKDEKKTLIGEVREFEEEDTDRHTKFVDQRRLCIMHFLKTQEGSKIILTPKGAAEFADYNLPVMSNRLLVFRADFFTPTYMPKGESVVLQTWVLDEPQELKEKEIAQRQMVGAREPQGEVSNVLSLATRFAGRGYDPYAYWRMFQAGTDGEIEVPLFRWDIDIYYREPQVIGFSMTKHGAMIDDITITQFDPEFFGIPISTAKTMAPPQRLSLEVAYEALSSAGLSMTDMQGRVCGVFMGDSGSEWGSLCPEPMSSETYAGKLNCVQVARIPHILGMVGPVCTCETACSSSLVAVGTAQSSLRRRQPDQNVLNVSTNIREAVVVGANTLLGPQGYIGLSGPGMLTVQGRCFTFDESADGFARAEGLGSIFLRMTANPAEALGRWGVLVGACVNQDGRSASLTAPHGPSQQQCIQASMQEGGYTPAEVSIAECHGTGTSLGDPIEVGAIRGVMAKRGDEPICLTSSKSNIGHGEATAGMAGLIKCVLMLNAQTGAPNLHLSCLNPHLDVNGFPVLFDTEMHDFQTNSGVSGVSSFGFGGTNARGDLWGNATIGYRKCLSGMGERQLELIF